MMCENTIYSSIGHVLSIEEVESPSIFNKSSGGNSAVKKKILRSFFKDVAFQILDDFDLRILLLDKTVRLDLDSLMEKFDVFFEKVQPTVVTFSSFMEVIVRKAENEADRPDLKMRHFIEKIVWEVYVSRTIDGIEQPSMEVLQDIPLKLFNIFNQFASFMPISEEATRINWEPESSPPVWGCEEPKMSATAFDLIVKNLKIKNWKDSEGHSASDGKSFNEFWTSIWTSVKSYDEKKINSLAKKISELHQVYVMDVLIQDMVMCKASNILNYNALTNRDSSFYNNEQNKFPLAKLRLVTVTSRYIQMISPETGVQLRLPLFNCEIKVGKPAGEHPFSRNKQVKLTVWPTTEMSQMSTNSLCIKLIFEEKDHFMIYKWRTKLEEAVGYSRSRLTPFQKMKNESSLKSDPSQDDSSDFSDDESDIQIAKGLEKGRCQLDGNI